MNRYYVSFSTDNQAEEYFRNNDVEIVKLKNIFEVSQGANVADTEIEFCATWHQHRLVTDSLPIRDQYDPVSEGDAQIYLLDAGIDLDCLPVADINLLYTVNEDFSEGPAHHGTILASLINDVSPQATVNIVKLANWETKFEFGNLLDCLDIILGDHLVSANVVKILNISWVMKKNPVLECAINQLIDANILVVAATGDNAENVSDLTPAGMERVLTVGASDSYDRVMQFQSERGSAETNWGLQVNLFAPGINVKTFKGVTSGSSAAAAITSAVAAQYCELMPELDAQSIRQKLMENAHTGYLYIQTDNPVPNKLLYTYNNFYKNPWQDVEELISVSCGTGVLKLDLPISETGIITQSEFAALPHFITLDEDSLSINTDLIAEEGIYQFVLIFTDSNLNEYSKILKLQTQQQTSGSEGVYFYTTAENNQKFSTGFSYAEMSTNKF